VDVERNSDDNAYATWRRRGIFGALKRVAGGGTFVYDGISRDGRPRGVGVCHARAGHIVPVEVAPGHEYMIHRHGFLCATPQIQLGVGFQQSLGAGVLAATDFYCRR